MLFLFFLRVLVLTFKSYQLLKLEKLPLTMNWFLKRCTKIVIDALGKKICKLARSFSYEV